MKSKYIHVLEVNIMVYSSRIVLTYCVMYSYMYRLLAWLSLSHTHTFKPAIKTFPDVMNSKHVLYIQY